MTRAGFSSLLIHAKSPLWGLVPFWRICDALWSGRSNRAHACDTCPDIVVLIDSPEFNHRVRAHQKAISGHLRYLRSTLGLGVAARASAKNVAVFRCCISLFPFETKFSKHFPGRLSFCWPSDR